MEWVKVFASASDARNRLVQNKPQLLLVRDKRICLVQTQEGLLAVEDTCPHNGESLSKGSVNFLGEIVCPWHGQRFKLKTGRECAERSRDLVTYQILEDERGIFIGL